MSIYERREDPMENGQTFFDFAAEVGLTKHLGGIKATEELIQLCHIDKGSYVLDVGCGVGVTPCFIAKNVGCEVVGVDIVERMIDRSWEMAKNEGVLDKVDFRVADAQEMPFEDDLFDAVITESVTAFPEEKQKAVNEYVRVTKPGGYVGLNESIWFKMPPPPEVIAWASQDLGGNVMPLPSDEWVELLEKAGLREITSRTYEISVQDESRGILQRYGFGGMLRIMIRMLTLFTKNPAYRKFVKRVQKEGVTPENLVEYFGYGVFVGRK
jgi:arsenite methyltransferase